MRGSMVDIQSAAAEIRRGIKKDRKKPRGKNIMSASAMQGGHNKTDATGSQSWYDKRHGRRTVRSEPPTTTPCGVSYKSVYNHHRTWKSCARLSRRNETVWTRKWLTMRSVNGAMTDDLRCSRRRTFWTFTLNITAFVHILINMFWTLLTLLSFL